MEERQIRQDVQNLMGTEMLPEACLRELDSLVTVHQTGTCLLPESNINSTQSDVGNCICAACGTLRCRAGDIVSLQSLKEAALVSSSYE